MSVRTMTKRGARDVAMASLAWVVLLSTTACIRVAAKRYDQVVAIGWENQDTPFALAQDVQLHKDAYLLSAEGPGVYETYRRGPLVVLSGDGRRISVDPGVESGAEIVIDNGTARASEPYVLVLGSATVHDVPASYAGLCLIVDSTGRTTPCSLPFSANLATGGYLPPGGREVWSRRFADRKTWFESVDVTTGASREIESFGESAGLRAYNECCTTPAPCDMSYARFSPAAPQWVAACTLEKDSRYVFGLWVIGDDQPPRLLHEVSRDEMILPRYSWNARMEDMTISFQQEYGLAWNPDGARVYWCGGRLSKGLIASLDGDAPMAGLPCLLLASWSPDGRSIAGVQDGKFVTCTVPASPDPSGMQCRRAAGGRR